MHSSSREHELRVGELGARRVDLIGMEFLQLRDGGGVARAHAAE